MEVHQKWMWKCRIIWTSQFQVVGHGSNPWCLSTCLHKHKLNSCLCISEIVHSLFSSQHGAAPCMYSHVAELPAGAPGLLGAGRGGRLDQGTCGVDRAVRWPQCPGRGRWHQHNLAALALAEKGKNKETRNCYLCGIRLYLNRLFFLHLWDHIYCLWSS